MAKNPGLRPSTTVPLDGTNVPLCFWRWHERPIVVLGQVGDHGFASDCSLMDSRSRSVSPPGTAPR